MKPTITVTEGGSLEDVRKALANLSHARVLVGIPEAETSRPGEVVTNAGLMYIHTHGAHLPNGAVIPARPVIEPAIEAPDNRELIEEQLGLAARAELDGKPDEMRLHCKLAGTLGANAAKRWFRDPRNNWQENADSTIAAKGSDRPLIGITGELRRAITHVEEFD